MNEPIYQAEDAVRTLKIYIDEDPINPREWDNLGVMVCSHDRYNLGDEQTNDIDDYFDSLAEELDPGFRKWWEYWNEGPGWSILCNRTKEGKNTYIIDVYDTFHEMVNKKIWKILDKHLIILPLYLYDHSGITMSTGPFSCPWDSGQVGFIYVEKKKVKEEWGWKRLTPDRIKKIERFLKAEVEVYDQYLRGDVYGFECEYKYPFSLEHEDFFDSCWGFYGSDWDENGLREHLPPDFQHLVDKLE